MSRIKIKIGVCPLCDNGKEVPLLGGFCQSHYWQKNAEKNKVKNKSNGKDDEKKKPKAIPKVSKKRQIENLKYHVLRTEFLGKKENSICPVTGEKTTEVHHKKGRVGNLFLDTNFWLAVSRNGHKMIEENPEWAKENGFSVNRL